ncbi:hypothetical protein C2I18_06035 [Paenibacillus sp. PK3_47]|uniref:hypothetical protein n=1 Tax=Paenibacillus sp. PK3_47 TaxID=2072642 RepID=UPI00201D7453|nr:hypothetical protein [Paenibacillus sp. PK3_47]UQZ33152.1 hypothetical protein C2I18_06035 [Paenibacillus sp. PK3_47]
MRRRLKTGIAAAGIMAALGSGSIYAALDSGNTWGNWYHHLFTSASEPVAHDRIQEANRAASALLKDDGLSAGASESIAAEEDKVLGQSLHEIGSRQRRYIQNLEEAADEAAGSIAGQFTAAEEEQKQQIDQLLEMAAKELLDQAGRKLER